MTGPHWAADEFQLSYISYLGFGKPIFQSFNPQGSHNRWTPNILSLCPNLSTPNTTYNCYQHLSAYTHWYSSRDPPQGYLLIAIYHFCVAPLVVKHVQCTTSSKKHFLVGFRASMSKWICINILHVGLLTIKISCWNLSKSTSMVIYGCGIPMVPWSLQLLYLISVKHRTSWIFVWSFRARISDDISVILRQYRLYWYKLYM